MSGSAQQRFSLLRVLKLGIFHIGSSFVDLLTSGVLNRVLISDLNIWATPVALLSALRYLLAPLSIWVGYRSDTTRLFGFYRLSYIWLGRLPMLLSLPLLPIVTVLLADNPRSILGWLLALFAFSIYGVGTLLSGSTYLALVRDSVPPAQRGLAISIVQIFLVASFPIAGIVYGRMMPVYDQVTFWQMVFGGMLVAGFCFGFALFRAEQPGKAVASEAAQEQLPFRQLLAEMWRNRQTRVFFLFLALGAISAFAQDAVLEPFGGDVFGLNAGETTRFNAYWGTGTIIGLIGTVILTRKRKAAEQSSTTNIGLVLTSVSMVCLTIVALTGARAMLIPALVFFGFGMGIYTIGAMSLLVAMTSERQAGAYFGLWTVAQLVFRGLGIFLGGAIRDVGLLVSHSPNIAYASVFFLEAIGLLICVRLVLKADVASFAKADQTAPNIALTALAE